MEWDEFLRQNTLSCNNGQILTDIKCPDCGKRIYYDSTITLTSIPPKYCYWCSCGWNGYATTKWMGYNNE